MSIVSFKGDWKMSNSIKKDTISKITEYIFIIFFSCIVLTKLVYPYKLVPWYLATAGMVAIISIFIFKKYDYICKKLNNLFNFIDKISYLKMILFIIGISLVTKILAIFIFNIYSVNLNSDVKTYIISADEFAKYGIVKTQADYCYTFSHMYWFAVFLSPIVKFFGTSMTAMSIYLTFILTISSALIFDVTAKSFSKNKAFIAIIIYNILSGQILLPQYITHENGMTFFLSISLWLYFRVIPMMKKVCMKVIIYILFTITLFISSCLNASGLVLFVAFIILFIIKFLSRASIKNLSILLLKCALLILILLIGNVIFKNFQIEHSQLGTNNNKTNQILWTLYVGCSGGNLENDFYDLGKIWYNYDNLSEAEADEYQKALLIEAYRSLLSKPEDICKLIISKFSEIWSNFNYSIDYSNETITNPNIQHIYNKFLFKPLSLISYSILLFISELGLFSLIKNRKKVKNDFYTLTELYLLGGTAMLLLTECKNKYAINMIPFFIIASVVLVDVHFNRKKHIK